MVGFSVARSALSNDHTKAKGPLVLAIYSCPSRMRKAERV